MDRGNEVRMGPAVFGGGKLNVIIEDNVYPVEAFTYTTSVEVCGNYTGKTPRDIEKYTTGKRVIVGSMVLNKPPKFELVSENDQHYDLAIFGRNKKGLAAICYLDGVMFVQKTYDHSEPHSNKWGLSFVVLKVSPWRAC